MKAAVAVGFFALIFSLGMSGKDLTGCGHGFPQDGWFTNKILVRIAR